MIKIDLITGFLGSGKTTFIKEYVKYLLSKNEKICILENDYGPINVDTLLLSDLKCDNLAIEMIVGGSDYDCHKRRFKSKLITMAMLGYSRVIVEPSGIFDIDEFFDTLQEEPLSQMYSINTILSIVDANTDISLSDEANFIMASVSCCAGKIIFSHVDQADKKTINKTLAYINASLAAINCNRRFDTSNIIAKDYNDLTATDFVQIEAAGFNETSYIKKYSLDSSAFQSLFFMNTFLEKRKLIDSIQQLFDNKDAGHIIRIKGFIKEDEQWYMINATKNKTTIETINNGQNVIIVIGENLNEKKIEKYIPSRFSTSNTL